MIVPHLNPIEGYRRRGRLKASVLIEEEERWQQKRRRGGRRGGEVAEEKGCEIIQYWNLGKLPPTTANPTNTISRLEFKDAYNTYLLSNPETSSR